MPDEGREVQGILYGRKWEIKIYKPAYKEENGEKVRDPEQDIEMDVSELRCIFKTSYALGTVAQLGTLVVYNMNIETEKATIEEGFQISVYGGYEQGQYGHIYTGDIIQVIRNRENGIDYRLEILAIRGSGPFDQNHVRATMAAQSLPRDEVNIICRTADKKLPVGAVSDNLTQQPLPRGKVIFGTPGKYLRDIAIANNAWFGINDEDKVQMVCINDEIPSGMVLDLTPNTGLVGTPKYTDNGIQIKMLLEPRLKIQSLVRIDNSIIQRQLVGVTASKYGPQINGVNQNLVFDENGEYQVMSIAHTMDTWGDEWTTDVVGIQRNGRMGLPGMVATSSQVVL